MRQTELRVVVTFYTTCDAMATESLCQSRALPGRLIPVPRLLSADCGIAWSAPVEAREAVICALEAAGVEYAGVHELEI